MLSENLLVTGTRGFIGSNLMNALQAESEHVFNLEEDYLGKANWQQSLIDSLNELNPHTIFHVGACSDTLNTDVQFMMERNYQSTMLMTDWAETNGRNLIFSSSAAVYGTNGLYPSNLYGWSKYVAESYVVQKGGLALRYFNVFGPGEEQKGRMSSFICQAHYLKKIGDPVYLFPGTPRRDFVYVKDVVEANLHAMRNFGELRNSWYEVGTGIASTFEAVLAIANISFEYADASSIPIGYQKHTCSNPKSWMNGWRPMFSLEESILEYSHYLRTLG